MKRLLKTVAVLTVALVLVLLANFALIEIGREVVTLRTIGPGGAVEATRLWIVDLDGTPWLHSAGSRWVARFDGEPVVEVERRGTIGRYRATLMPSRHPDVDAALREKYGLADRWIQWIAPCGETSVPVRLVPVAG